MRKTKMEKGITLIALIISIVILLILAVVSIGAIKESKIIEHAQTAKKTYNEEKIKEDVTIFCTDYLLTTNRNIQETTKDTMIKICKETGVKAEQLAVHYDLYNVKENNEEHEKVLYRIDKTTEEEQKILEENGIKGLHGDVDLDGILTEGDMKILSNVVSSLESLETETKVIIGDMNGDGNIDNFDVGILDSILRGLLEYNI